MAQRECLVRFQVSDVVHEVTVNAESVFEAAARALSAFQQDDWASTDAVKTGYVEIFVRAPTVRHKLLLKNLDSWLHRQGRTTKEMEHKAFVRSLLKGEDDRAK